MVNWMIGGAIILAMFFAARYAWRKAKNGQCVGCSDCKSGGCHCGCGGDSADHAKKS
ncbi:FeoB-associated Cys-rich membrane protein [Anaerotruncus colihominis]|uniref:FeoB-associated Cys-rich membrane protein n=1 Tax=Anaerotruncus colihominis TaxID=169435 RepID=UPI0024B27C17|nr:FeoB-associated Cys-rich membrane protein [Anaerotruncus colihominis]